MESQYVILKKEDEKFPKLASKDDWKQFMVDHDYSGSLSPEEVTEVVVSLIK
ncbi:MAG: hypothetical protein ACJAQT_003553 [Akkermansiaceae bacterium]